MLRLEDGICPLRRCGTCEKVQSPVLGSVERLVEPAVTYSVMIAASVQPFSFR